MQRLRLCGRFRVIAPDSASQYLGRAMAKLARILEDEGAGSITCSPSRVAYKRGYSLLRFSSNRLTQFDPGEILLSTEGNEILVQYSLGVEPLYLPTFLVGACLLMLGFLPGGIPLVVPVGLLGFGLLSFGVMVGIVRVRAWLKSAIVSAVHEIEVTSLT